MVRDAPAAPAWRPDPERMEAAAGDGDPVGPEFEAPDDAEDEPLVPGAAPLQPAAPGGPLLACGLCGARFAEDRGQPACLACPLLAGRCRYVRCPRCGYENPLRPPWLARVEGWLLRAGAARARRKE